MLSADNPFYRQVLGFISASTAKAEDPQCYTVASLQGTYASVATYSANVALALGVRHFDGHGNLTGTFTLNAPDLTSATGARKIITGTQVGTYTVNCDGTGVETRTLTSSTGVVTVQMPLSSPSRIAARKAASFLRSLRRMVSGSKSLTLII